MTKSHGRTNRARKTSQKGLSDAALPDTSGARHGLPASVTHVPAALRTALAGGDEEALAELGPSLAETAGAPQQLPDDAEGRRLAAAPNARSKTIARSATPAKNREPDRARDAACTERSVDTSVPAPGDTTAGSLAAAADHRSSSNSCSKPSATSAAV